MLVSVQKKNDVQSYLCNEIDRIVAHENVYFSKMKKTSKLGVETFQTAKLSLK